MVESSILSSAFFCFFLHLHDTPRLLVDFQPNPTLELGSSFRRTGYPRSEKRVFVTFGAVLPDLPPSLALGLLLALKELNVPKSASGPLHPRCVQHPRND